MQYELKGGNFPVVVCQLASGEQMITEKGSMVWMSPNREMKPPERLGQNVLQGLFWR